MKISVVTSEHGSNNVFTSRGHAKNWRTANEAVAYGMGYQRGFQEAINMLGGNSTLEINGQEQ